AATISITSFALSNFKCRMRNTRSSGIALSLSALDRTCTELITVTDFAGIEFHAAEEGALHSMTQRLTLVSIFVLWLTNSQEGTVAGFSPRSHRRSIWS